MTATSLLALGSDRSLYVGELPATDWHRHGAPVLLIGLSGPIDVALAGGPRERCRSAMVAADVEHVLDPRGERVAVLYLEPDAPEFLGVRARCLGSAAVAYDLAARPTGRGAFERRLLGFDIEGLVGVSRGPVIDARIARTLPSLRAGGDTDRQGMATAADLSTSRFNHLFRTETGVSFRRYRLWTRLRGAIRSAATTRTLTDAALDGGFADSAHFSRVFRDMFGLTPSAVLKDLRHLDLHD
ncbi:MAG TPA: helix-turn-helix domain-containing protein [Candidatus Binatia bacterium]|jgi:AraC-like DNA-binding protein|nr:helix-turn-helix domain-containing protein [Candidatus Binatia bacterium]